MERSVSFKKLDRQGVTAASGFQAAGIAGGIKKGKKDIALIYSDKPAVAAGVFTLNQVQAAPVHVCKEHLQNQIRAVVINSGNANACTGMKGMQDAQQMVNKTAETLSLENGAVMVSSTGVIGMPLPMDKIMTGIETAAESLGRGIDFDLAAALAIMTTDTRPKQTAYRCSTPGGTFHIGGMSKGSGMICPNMATMLAYLTTDVKIERDFLQQLFAEAADKSFNAITVDGETSTNDTALIIANGAAENIEITPRGEYLPLFREVLSKVCQELAMMIVEDGEGLTKVLTLKIRGADDESGARKMARSVLNSPLVKTAFYGEDANWGRIIAAMGYSGIEFDPSEVDIYIGPYQVASSGGAVPFSEEKMKKVLQARDISILIDLKLGQSEVTAWGTDMSHEYISINSDYRS